MSKAATRFCIASIKLRYSRSETGTLASRSSAKNEKNTATTEPSDCPSPRPSPRKRGREKESPSPCASGEREGPVAQRRGGEGRQSTEIHRFSRARGGAGRRGARTGERPVRSSAEPRARAVCAWAGRAYAAQRAARRRPARG